MFKPLDRLGANGHIQFPSVRICVAVVAVVFISHTLKNGKQRYRNKENIDVTTINGKITKTFAWTLVHSL